MPGFPDTPLFVETHDFVLWLIRHSQRLPSNLRHTYTQRLELALLDFQEAILMGNAASEPQRAEWLEIADGKLLCLRTLLRVAYDLELLGGNPVKFAVERVDELGRLLGAWKKGTGRYRLGRVWPSTSVPQTT